ncbi:hypothetical protein AVEN_9208-1 [Araneus ventricosus]|uniref:Uncharacterized protein n=1 Tax=Araneus ventricosus TaxID=182803 RepID=A0A4Y2JSE3_ARAVE|nr:hypothetical protein AVEN_9208-1 [Araneus ventricosus]
MAPRGCLISPNNFCFICGEYTVKSQQRISDFVKKVYFAYFKLKLGDQDKPWLLTSCEEDLRLWFKETMGDKEKEAWDSFKYVVQRFGGNTKDLLYKTNVQSMLTANEAQECKMSLKGHFHTPILTVFLKP